MTIRNYTTSAFALGLLGAGAIIPLSGLAVSAADENSAELQHSETDISIEDFIGVIEIRNGNHLSWSLDMNEDLVPEPEIIQSGNQLYVAGDDNVDIRSCMTKNKQTYLQISGKEKEKLEAYPRLVIEMPADSSVAVGLNSGMLKMADAGELSLGFFGCGGAVFGNVVGDVEIGLFGSGDVTGGSVGEASIAINGSGDVRLGDVRGDAAIAISGSGDTVLGRVSGETAISVSGSGDVKIANVQRELAIKTSGSGDVEVSEGDIDDLAIMLVGSGDVDYKGKTNDVSVLLNGSGDVYVARLNGNKVVERFGSGDVRIGSWHSDDED